jgi:hypothetical protein
MTQGSSSSADLSRYKPSSNTKKGGKTIEPEVQGGDTIITNPVIEAKALLDTGSLPGNFVIVDLLKRINGTDSIHKTDHPIRVCSGHV